MKTMSSEGPRRISKIEINLYMPSNNFSNRDKIILEKAAHHCPVAKSLHPDLEEVVHIHW